MENKYDTTVTLENNSSLTYIIKKIDPGSVVLEFGPATGYMTKYLKEERNCQVYIVEIDEEAFKTASPYAEGAVCGSAENIEWYERFKDIQFDYITFADVLEHLVDPGQVLKQSTKLLKKETGKILISLPNIGHNAVLVDLLNNKFEYRKTGIMDNTHLRFFTHDSAVKMFHENGLYVEDEDAVMFPLEYAGFENSEKDVSENVWSELRLRKYGFVNQFLFTLTLNSNNIEYTGEKQITAQYESALYYTLDEQYSEDRKLLSNVELKENEFFVEFSFEPKLMVKQMMIGLLPFHGYIYDVKVETDTGISEIDPIGGITVHDKQIFWENDIRIQVNFPDIEETSFVHITGKVGAVQISDLEQYISNLREEQEQAVIIRDLEIHRLNEVIEEKIQIIRQLGNEIHEKEGLLEEKNQVIHQLSDEMASDQKE